VKGVNTTGGWNTGGWNTGVNTGVGVNMGGVGAMGSVPPHPFTPHSDWSRIRPVVCTGCVLAKTSSHCRVSGSQRAWVAVGVTKFVVADVNDGVVTKFVVAVLPVATAAETCCCVATFK
jgi:hypothetical protein